VIRVRIEILPFGEEPAQEIAMLDIVNLGNHDKAPYIANYEVTGRHNSYGQEIKKVFTLFEHQRELGIFPLLERICKAWRGV
jgi:hypothetical protein